MDQIVKTFLDKFEKVTVLYEGQEICLLDKLKKIPRSGKSSRIDYFGLNLPKRSIFDHIISLAREAEFLGKLSGVKFDIEILAGMIASHDLSEALIGDAPDFTSEELTKGAYLTASIKEQLEEKANMVIQESLNKTHIEIGLVFKKSLEVLDDTTSDTWKFFYMIDKVDALVAIWRYIYLFRESIEIEKFLEAMNDFFTNPRTSLSCIDEKPLELVTFLQVKDNARQYYHGGAIIITNSKWGQDLTSLIESRPMHFVDQ